MQREDKKGKLLFRLIPRFFLEQLARHYTDGASNYGEDNWKNGTEEDMQICKDAAYRHFIQWVNGDDDENHFIACIWNMIAYEWLRRKFDLINKEKE